MTILQKTGLGLFIIALLIFTATLAIDQFVLSESTIRAAVGNEYHQTELIEQARAQNMLGRSYGSSFSFVPAFEQLLKDAQRSLKTKAESGLPEGMEKSEYKLPGWKFKGYTLAVTRQANTGPVAGNPLLFLLLTIGLGVLGGLLYILPKFRWIPGIKHDHIYHKSMTRGVGLNWRGLFLGGTLVGVLLYGVYHMNKDYFWPAFTLAITLLISGLVFIYHRSVKRTPAKSASPNISGWLGIITGLYLIGFYVLLYWSPQHITSWVILANPLSEVLNGGEASRWFMYGLLYTLAILVMGVRMFAKYQHNRYQLIRTGSVMFFQAAFAFLIPQFIAALNRGRADAGMSAIPEVDLKNIWPLDYSFFFSYRLDTYTATEIGVWMLGWGIALIILGVPIITYFYGKRWYCSWVCGCGGLAETLGDPYRQLSDKSLRAWLYERWIIHGVLVFAVVMTMAVLHSYLPVKDAWITQDVFLWIMIIGLAAAMAYVYYRWKAGKVDISSLGIYVGLGITVLLIGASAYHLVADVDKFLFMSSNNVRQWYGFIIGAGFAGVVGTGFYPIMGNRVWCRFGCPLAAYLGLVQRFKSRFRITTNGGQCISCGNCSTYCEMGIDVRWYAQRGQNIVRSSCVGCGVCAAVCPRGVLRLENSAEDITHRTTELKALHISEKEGIKIM